MPNENWLAQALMLKQRLDEMDSAKDTMPYLVHPQIPYAKQWIDPIDGSRSRIQSDDEEKKRLLQYLFELYNPDMERI